MDYNKSKGKIKKPFNHTKDKSLTSLSNVTFQNSTRDATS